MDLGAWAPKGLKALGPKGPQGPGDGESVWMVSGESRWVHGSISSVSCARWFAPLHVLEFAEKRS